MKESRWEAIIFESQLKAKMQRYHCVAFRFACVASNEINERMVSLTQLEYFSQLKREIH